MVANMTVLVALACRLRGNEGENNTMPLGLYSTLAFRSRSTSEVESQEVTVHQITINYPSTESSTFSTNHDHMFNSPSRSQTDSDQPFDPFEKEMTSQK